MTEAVQLTLSEPRAYVKDLREGLQVDECYLLESKSLRFTKDSEAFLALELRDRTGIIQARYWSGGKASSEPGELERRLRPGAVVRVKGRVGRFRDALQINLLDIEPIPESDTDLSHYLAVSPRDPAEMGREYDAFIARLDDRPLQALCLAFASDEEFMARFRRAPAAKLVHHAYLGGLLEHTLEVAALSVALAEQFPTSLDRDLLLTGALLHDVGKVHELSFEHGFDYTDEGQLVGHLVIGARMVAERSAGLAGLSPDRRMLVEHLILSHHGQHEWGSPKLPATREALVLHHADDLSAKLNHIDRFLEVEGGNDQDGHWTSYNRFLERSLYRGPGTRRGLAGATEE